MVATFDEDLVLGSGNITIYNVTLGSVAATIDVTDSSQVTLAGNVLTINPAAVLDTSTEYAVQLAAGVVKNLNDLPNAAITDTTTWSFTTQAVASYTWIQGGDPDNWEDPGNWLGGGVPPRAVAGTVVVFGPATSGQIGGEPPDGKVTVGSMSWETSFELRDLGNYTDYNSGIFSDSGTSEPAMVTMSGNMTAYYVNWTLNTDMEFVGNGRVIVRAYNSRGVEGPGGFIIGSGVEVQFDKTHGGHNYNYTGGVTIKSGGIADVNSVNGALGDGRLTIEEDGLLQMANSAIDQDVTIVLTSNGANPATNSALTTGGGTSTVLSGELTFDVSAVEPAVGNQWQTFGGTVVYDAAFSVAGFTEGPAGVWTGDIDGTTYAYEESTGVLEVTSITPSGTFIFVK
jgi:hypothetical protein